MKLDDMIDHYTGIRINAVMDELPEKATVVAVDDLRGWINMQRRETAVGLLGLPMDTDGLHLSGRLLYHVDTLEGFHMRLQKETTYLA